MIILPIINFYPESSINSLINFAYENFEINPKLSLDYIHEAFDRLDESIDSTTVSRLYEIKGIIYSEIGLNDSALHYIDKSFEYVTPKNQDRLFSIYNNKAHFLMNDMQFVEASKYYQKAIFEKPVQENLNKRIEILINLARSYQLLTNYDKAMSIYLEIIDLMENTDDFYNIATMYRNLGVLYQGDSKFDLALEQFIKSEKYYKMVNAEDDLPMAIALKIECEIGLNRLSEAKSNFELLDALTKENNFDFFYLYKNELVGRFLNKSKQYTKAVKHYKNILKHKQKFQDQYYITTFQIELARNLLQTNQITESLEFLNKAEDKISNSDDYLFRSKLYELLAQANSKRENYADAFRYLSYVHEMHDSLNAVTHKNYLTNLQVEQIAVEAKYEYSLSKKKSELKEMELKRNIMIRNFILSGLVLLIVIALLVILRLHEKKSFTKKKIELEKIKSALAMAVTASHELNQPLMTLQANLEMLSMSLENGSLTDKQKKYLDRILTSIDTMSKHLHTYKNNSKIDFDEYTEDTDMVIFDKDEK
jgi:tetratricopeptide (TPR) repeat protein